MQYCVKNFTFGFFTFNDFFLGDIDGAKLSLSICLDSDPTFSEAHLLMAQVLNQPLQLRI